MQPTAINWTELTWNPASGCTKVSEECKHCYAETLAENKRGTRAFPNGFDVTLRPWKLAEPARVKKPSLIFCNSMTDMFHESISDEYRDQTLAAMRAASRHRYQVLTKRPENAYRYFQTRKVPECMWLGVTVGVQKTTPRLDWLRKIDAPCRFISAEPLLEEVTFDLSGMHWLICGGESGAHLSKPANMQARGMVRPGDRKSGEHLWMPREDRIPWARSLRDQCLAAGVAFYFKQWGGPQPTSGGRILDDRTWDEMPAWALPEAYDHMARSMAHQIKLPIVQ